MGGTDRRATRQTDSNEGLVPLRAPKGTRGSTQARSGGFYAAYCSLQDTIPEPHGRQALPNNAFTKFVPGRFKPWVSFRNPRDGLTAHKLSGGVENLGLTTGKGGNPPVAWTSCIKSAV